MEQLVLDISFGITRAPWNRTKHIVTSIIRFYKLEVPMMNRWEFKNTVLECYEQTCQLLNIRRYTFRKMARRWGANVKYDKYINKFTVTFNKKKDAKRFINFWLMSVKLMDSLASNQNEKDLYSIENFLT